MLPYLFAFFISILATYNSQKYNSYNCGFYVHAFFAVAPLVIVAALRDSSIGTDTLNYIYLFQNGVRHRDSLMTYIILNPSFEIGFLVYNFLIVQIVSKLELYYVITYSMIFGITFSSAVKMRKYIAPHIFMIIYVFLFFSDSLNLMRQYIAVSFVLLAVSFLFNGKKNIYILLTFLASTIHTSAIVSIVIGGMYFILRKYPFRTNKFIYLLICVLIVITSVNIDIFTNMGLVPVFEEKLNSHLTISSDGGVSNSHIMIYLFTLTVVFCFHKNNFFLELILLLQCFTMIILLSPSVNSILYRLTIYFNIMICYAISYIYKNSHKEKTRILLYMLIGVYIFFYFFSIVINGTHEVIPYSSKILGI